MVRHVCTDGYSQVYTGMDLERHGFAPVQQTRANGLHRQLQLNRPLTPGLLAMSWMIPVIGSSERVQHPPCHLHTRTEAARAMQPKREVVVGSMGMGQVTPSV